MKHNPCRPSLFGIGWYCWPGIGGIESRLDERKWRLAFLQNLPGDGAMTARPGAIKSLRETIADLTIAKTRFDSCYGGSRFCPGCGNNPCARCGRNLGPYEECRCQ